MYDFFWQFPLLAFMSLGLYLCMITDTLQLYLKYLGVKRNTVASGYNSAMKAMVINRVGAVFYFFFMSLLIDRSTNTSELSIYVLLSIFVTAITLIVWMRIYIKPISISKNIFVFVSLATLFNVMGLTLPFLLASSFHDYRLTLANTSFLFNTVYTVLNVFYIENKFAKLADYNSEEIEGFLYTSMIARFFMYIIYSVLGFSVFMFI